MKIFCHQCGKHTNHNVLIQENVSSPDPDDSKSGETHYFARCAGCEAFNYAIEEWYDNNRDTDTGEWYPILTTYPQGSSELKPIDDVYELPFKVRLIYKEIISSMNAQLPVLSGIGLRALIESICRDQGIDGHNLEQLINGLATNGVLSKAQADILHTHRFLGNAAAHEITSAKPRELVAALEIAENILRTIYILPELSKQVTTGRKTPAHSPQ
ncbi:DUF4145 domain-containing protein [Candidatus Electronema halotolerans]